MTNKFDEPAVAYYSDEAYDTSSSLISLQGFLHFFRKRWYLYLLSLAVCLGIAWLMVKRTPDIYTRSETVLIKDPTFGNGAASVDLSDVGVMPKYANLENEIAIFTSPDLLEDVVRMYRLNNFYSVSDGYKDVDIYGKEPAVVSCADAAAETASFSFTYKVDDKGIVTVTDCRQGDTRYDKKITARTGSVVQTPVGKVVFDMPEGISEYAGKTIHYSHIPVRAAAEGIAAGLQAECEQTKGTLIKLTYNSTSPERASAVLRGIVQAYNDQWVNDKKSIADATSAFINERLAIIEKELGSVDSNISSYKSRTMTPDLEQASQLHLTRSAELQGQQYDIANQIAVVNFIRGELNRESVEETLPSNMGTGNTGLEELIQQYNQAVIERNRLLHSTGVNNPQVVERGEALRTMKRNIQHSASTYVTALTTRLNGIRSQENLNNSQLASAPRQANYLLSAERQQKVKESLYLFLLQKREENELAQAFTAFNTQVVRQPAGPALPVSPKPLQAYIVAFVLGLVIPSVIYILRANLDTKVRSREEVESLGIPFIGEIPQQGRRRFRPAGKDDEPERRIVVRSDGADVINEAFRVVRANLDFLNESGRKDGGQVIMITSSNPGSGKTFVSINLAVALALKGKKVLLMDFDLRRASLSDTFGSPRKGITNYLIGNATEEDIVTYDAEGVAGLDLIGVGAVPPNPSELLYSDNLRTLIAGMRKKYDYIFFDCPPIELVADSRILNQYVDTTIFVIRAGLFDRIRRSGIII